MPKFSKYFASYIFKYFLAFIIVLSTSFIIFITAKSQIENYILDRTRLQVNRGIDLVEESIGKVELASQMIYKSDGFSQLLYPRDESTAQTILQIKKSNELIKKISYLMDYSPYTFVLFKKNDFFLSSGQCALKFDEYYGNFLSASIQGASFDTGSDLKHFLFDIYKKGKNFIMFDSFAYKREDKEVSSENVLLYLTAKTGDYKSQLYINCFVLSSDYLIETILTSEQMDNGYFYIQDASNGNRLFAYGEIPEQTEACAENILQKSNGYYSTAIVSKKLGWRVVIGIPTAIVEKQLEASQNILALYLGAGLAIVIILTLYFSCTRYHGFRKVLRAIPEEEVSREYRKSVNDFDLLTNNVAELESKREAYHNKASELLEQNQSLLMEKMIIQGNSSEQERKMFQAYFGKEPEHYCIVIVQFEQNEFLENSKMISNVMADFLTVRQIPLIGKVRNGIGNVLLLLDMTGLKENGTDWICQIFEQLAEEMSEKYKVKLHVGVSNVWSGLSNISRCYDQAKYVMQSMYVWEKENRVQVFHIDSNYLCINTLSIEFLERLYTVLICGRYNEAANAINLIEQDYAKMPHFYEAHRERVFYSLENVFFSALQQLGLKGEEDHLPLFDSSQSYSEMLGGFIQCAGWICECIASGKKSNNENLKDKIMDILNKNYKEPGLSPYMVSQEVGISENYLYHFWKEQTGETFSNYLLRIRISKAKEYLENTNYSNKEIADLTGFSSVNTFYRNFQKLTGVSPKVYQEEQKNKTIS